MAKLKCYDVTLQYDGSNVDAKFGNDANLSVNLSELSTALSAASAVIGLKKSLAVGGAVAATFLAARLVKQKWDWININSMKAKNKVAVSFPEDHESEFDEIMEKKMHPYLQEAFAKPDESVKKIVAGEQCSQAQVDEIVEKLKGCQLTSVSSESSPGIPDGTIGGVIESSANVTETLHNENRIVVGAPGQNTIGEVIRGKVTRISYGGVSTVIGNASDKNSKEIAMARGPGNRLRVVVRFEDFSERFESTFKENDTIHDLKAALKKDRGKIYNIKNTETDATIGNKVSFWDLEKQNPSIRTDFLEASE